MCRLQLPIAVVHRGSIWLAWRGLLILVNFKVELTFDMEFIRVDCVFIIHRTNHVMRRPQPTLNGRQSFHLQYRERVGLTRCHEPRDILQSLDLTSQTLVEETHRFGPMEMFRVLHHV